MNWSNRGLILSGLALCLTLVGGLAAWGLGTTLSGAVIARGEIRPAAASQPVEVLEPGRIAVVAVAEGDLVRRGAVLLTLDDAALRAEEQALLCAREVRLAARERLRAEAAGDETLRPLANRGPDCGAAGDREAQIFVSGLALWRAREAVLADQIAQAQVQADGARQRLAALDAEIAVVSAEFDRTRELADRALLPVSAPAPLSQQLSALGGKRVELVTAIALAEGQAATYRGEIRRIAAERRDTAARALAEIEEQIAQIETDLAATRLRLGQLTLTAPIEGTVTALAVSEPGTAVRPGLPLLTLVPTAAPRAELYLSPEDISAVHVGQTVLVRLLTRDAAMTPEIAGVISQIGADQIKVGEAAAYLVMVTLDDDAARRLGPTLLIPGTPVEALIATETRTPFSYLARPFTDYFTRALRD